MTAGGEKYTRYCDENPTFYPDAHLTSDSLC